MPRRFSGIETDEHSAMTTDELYRKWYDRLVAYFARTCRPQEAEDLAQDLFVHYVQTLCRGVLIRTPEHWLWRAARNLATDRYRHYARRPVIAEVELADLELEDPQQPDPLDLACRGEARAAIAVLLPELSPAQRRALALRYGGDLGHRDVALRLGISLTAAKARHYRAIVHLRDLAGGG